MKIAKKQTSLVNGLDKTRNMPELPPESQRVNDNNPNRVNGRLYHPDRSEGDHRVFVEALVSEFRRHNAKIRKEKAAGTSEGK